LLARRANSAPRSSLFPLADQLMRIAPASASEPGGCAVDESRRDLIKKAALGAGVAWTAPLLTSVGPAAAAGTPPPTTTTSSSTTTSTTPPPPTCSNCQALAEFCDTHPFVLPRCGTPGAGVPPLGCLCVPSKTADGTGPCVCIHDVPASFNSCSTTADCPSGFACIPNCGDPNALGHCFQFCPA
jgi:hypothetical protein